METSDARIEKAEREIKNLKDTVQGLLTRIDSEILAAARVERALAEEIERLNFIVRGLLERFGPHE